MPLPGGEGVGRRGAWEAARRLAGAAGGDGLRRLSRPAQARRPGAHPLPRAPDRATPEPWSMSDDSTAEPPGPSSDGSMLHKRVDRRGALGLLLGGAVVGSQALGACAPLSAETDEEREVKLLAWREYIKGNYRFMTEAERAETIARLERLAQLQRGLEVTIQSTG